MVEYLLENIHVLRNAELHEERILLHDLTTAINSAEFTDREREVLTKLYLREPEPPQRDRVDKNGFTNGRPPGGTTQASLAKQLGVSTWTISNIKQSLVAKIAIQLGEDYVFS